MVTKEELQEKYVKMETANLLEIATDKVGYTELANSFAYEELRRRRIPKEDIVAYQPVARKIDDATMNNYLVDLEFSQKLLYFYVMWLPKARKYYEPAFKQNGFILKRDQSNYYSVLGLIFFMVTVGYLVATDSIFAFILVSGMCFVLCYLYDIYFNRERQMKNLEKAVEAGELPWDF